MFILYKMVLNEVLKVKFPNAMLITEAKGIVLFVTAVIRTCQLLMRKSHTSFKTL